MSVVLEHFQSGRSSIPQTVSIPYSLRHSTIPEPTIGYRHHFRYFSRCRIVIVVQSLLMSITKYDSDHPPMRRTKHFQPVGKLHSSCPAMLGRSRLGITAYMPYTVTAG